MLFSILGLLQCAILKSWDDTIGFISKYKQVTIIVALKRFCSYVSSLKEYYEIVDEARPLSGFFPTHADFFTEMHF